MKYSENRIRKVIKQILLESYSKKRILSEIKLKKFKTDLVGSKISNEYYEEHIFNSKKNKIRKPFDDSDYLQVLYNSINVGQGHSIEDFIDFYVYFKNYMKMQERDPNSLEEDLGAGEKVSLVGKINKGNVSATLDDLIRFNQARIAVGKGNKVDTVELYQSVLNTGGKHFDVILDNSEWIICYPKTVTGSKALSRSYWNGSNLQMDETFQSSSGRGEKIGRMPWCTNADGDANRFISYQGKANFHLYYCIKKQTENQEKPDRKLCIGFTKKSGKANLIHKSTDDKLANLGATVDSNNKILEEKDVYDYLGKVIVNKLFEDVSREDKEDLDLVSYYSSMSFKIYKQERVANNDVIEDFAQEFKNIVKYSFEADKIILFSAKDQNENINQHCFNIFYNTLRTHNSSSEKAIPRQFIESKISPERIVSLKNSLIEIYLEENNVKRLEKIASLTDRQDLLERFANSNNDKLKNAVIANKNISEDLINLFLEDDSLDVKTALINNTKVKANTKIKIIEEDPSMIQYSESVRDFILTSQKSTESLIKKLFYIHEKNNFYTDNFYFKLACNPNTPKEILKEILNISFEQEDERTINRILLHPKLDEETIIENLEQISEYNNLLQMLVRSPSCSSKILEIIINDYEKKFEYISGRAKQEAYILTTFIINNPNMTPELLSKAIEMLSSGGYDIQSLLKFMTKAAINKLFELDEWKLKIKNEYPDVYKKVDKEKKEVKGLELDMNESLLRETIRGVILGEGGRGRRVIAFDFHDTLVSDKEGGGYEPRERMIDKVRGYYGNYDFIVIYTAAPESDRAEVASYLEKFKIPYDVLVMEKPRFDKMYDDRYIGPEDDWV